MPYDERDDDTNQFTRAYADNAFLEAVAEHEPAGTRDVADHVGCHINLARERLKQLASDGQLEQTTVGQQLVFVSSE